MNFPAGAINLSTGALSAHSGSRSVLLVDVHSRTRESRAQTMRKLGATVDCVSSAVSGLAQFTAGLYRLVLIDLGRDVEGAEDLARAMRLKNPKQLVGFMVAGPALIAKTLRKPIPPAPVPPAPMLVIPALAEISAESEFGRRVREIEQRSDSSRDEAELGGSAGPDSSL